MRKDAGDDPDMTDGLEIFSIVKKIRDSKIVLDGGPGVGRVTKKAWNSRWEMQRSTKCPAV